MENITLSITQDRNVEEHKEGQTKTMIMELICEVILMLIVGIFGVVGNLMSIGIFSRLKKKQLTFHRLMILLASFDTVYILLIFIFFSQRHLHHTPRTCETGPGNPSGHAMINMVLWYILADALSSSKLVDNQLGEASR